MVDAGFEGERGVLAFRRLLSFGSGVYGVTFGPELHRGSLLMDLTFLRHQVLPALERFARLREVGVPLAARLTVDFQRLAEHLSSLPDEVVSLVRLFDGRRTVRAVLLECHLTEVVAFETVMHLFVLGVLVPACHVEVRERGHDAPRFFEPEAEAARVAREAQARDAEERAADEHEARRTRSRSPWLRRPSSRSRLEAAEAAEPASRSPVVEEPRGSIWSRGDGREAGRSEPEQAQAAAPWASPRSS